MQRHVPTAIAGLEESVLGRWCGERWISWKAFETAGQPPDARQIAQHIFTQAKPLEHQVLLVEELLRQQEARKAARDTGESPESAAPDVDLDAVNLKSSTGPSFQCITPHSRLSLLCVDVSSLSESGSGTSTASAPAAGSP